MTKFNTRTSRRHWVALTAAACAAISFGVQAQSTWPTKPVTLVVPFPAGGGTDSFARPLSAQFTKQTGKTLVIDNRGGAGGNLGSAEVAKQAPADGYTLLLAASGPMAVNPSLFRNMPFEPLTDLTPVVQISSFPLVLEVHPSVGVRTV